jgi:DNA-binding transcriptional MerR regulator
MTGWRMSSHDDVLISTGTAALLHDVSRHTVSSWVRRGWLAPTHVDPDGSRWFLPQDVDKVEMEARHRDRTGRALARIR